MARESDRTEPVNIPQKFVPDDTRFALERIAMFQYLAMGIFLFLISGFFILQVQDGEANGLLAERNRIKTVPLLAPRGKLLDRDGRVLVDNYSAFSVMLSRETLKPEHIDAIAQGLDIDPEEIRARLKHSESRPRYFPISIKQDLTSAEIAFVESHADPATFPELELVESHRRVYPKNGLGAHVIGYVGEISETELNASDFARYAQGDIVGKSGLERQYNDELVGIDGQKRVMVDSMGHERETLERIEEIPGKSLQTTLDLDLQAVAELSLEDQRGAVVALDPRTGEVLAMVSRPAYDLTAFSTHITSEYWKQLNSGGDNPLLNRAIQAQFAPGSTFKPIVAMAALENHTIDEHFTQFCPGGATFYGRYFKCDLKTGHGTLDLHHALTVSCDVFFYNVGNKLGIDQMARFAETMGIGKKTGIDLPNEAEGLMPSTRWKRRTQHQEWYGGETISVAIGQGAVTVTPIQLASVIGGMVSGGVWYKPHLVKMAAPQEPRRVTLGTENVAAVVSGMYGVVNEGGTGASAHIDGIELSGKTGSAQRVSNDLRKSGKLGSKELLDNGWFVGFAPRENPEIVVVALLEGGEHGALAAPIVRDVVKAYFDKKLRLTQKSNAPPSIALFVPPRMGKVN
jgi:penicillin-binding protein 2